MAEPMSAARMNLEEFQRLTKAALTSDHALALRSAANLATFAKERNIPLAAREAHNLVDYLRKLADAGAANE